MDKSVKAIIFILIALYVISPVDAAPGPLDDILVMLMGYAANKRLSAREN